MCYIGLSPNILQKVTSRWFKLQNFYLLQKYLLQKFQEYVPYSDTCQTENYQEWRNCLGTEGYRNLSMKKCKGKVGEDLSFLWAVSAGCPWLCMSCLKLIYLEGFFSSYFISLIKSPACTTLCFSFLVVKLTNDFKLGIQLLPESRVSSCSFNFVWNYVNLGVPCSKALFFLITVCCWRTTLFLLFLQSGSIFQAYGQHVLRQACLTTGSSFASLWKISHFQ